MDNMKLQSESREQRAERLTTLANEAFRNHAIASRENGRWLLRNPSSSNFWTEIIVGHGGYLLVYGDVDHVIWGTFNDRYNSPDRVIRWIGSHPVVDSYTAGKAVIGTGAKLAQEVDPNVYARDLLDLLDEDEDGDDAEDGTLKNSEVDYVDAIRESLERVALGDATEEVDTFLRDEGVDFEVISSLGCVPAVRVYFAHAAVVRLHALLTAEDEAAEAERAHWKNQLDAVLSSKR